MSGREEVWRKVSGDEAGETEAQLFRVWCESAPPPPPFSRTWATPIAHRDQRWKQGGYAGGTCFNSGRR